MWDDDGEDAQRTVLNEEEEQEETGELVHEVSFSIRETLLSVTGAY